MQSYPDFPFDPNESPVTPWEENYDVDKDIVEDVNLDQTETSEEDREVYLRKVFENSTNDVPPLLNNYIPIYESDGITYTAEFQKLVDDYPEILDLIGPHTLYWPR